MFILIFGQLFVVGCGLNTNNHIPTVKILVSNNPIAPSINDDSPKHSIFGSPETIDAIEYTEINNRNSYLINSEFDVNIEQNIFNRKQEVSSDKYIFPYLPYISNNYFQDFANSSSGVTFKNSQYYAIFDLGTVFFNSKNLPLSFVNYLGNPSRTYFSLNGVKYIMQKNSISHTLINSFSVYKNTSDNLIYGSGIIFKSGLVFILDTTADKRWSNIKSIVYVTGNLTPADALNNTTKGNTIEYEEFSMGIARQSIRKNIGQSYRITYINSFLENIIFGYNPVFEFSGTSIKLKTFSPTGMLSNLLFHFTPSLMIQKNVDNKNLYKYNFYITKNVEQLSLQNNIIYPSIAGFPHSLYFDLRSNSFTVSSDYFFSERQNRYGTTEKENNRKQSLISLSPDKLSYLLLNGHFYGKEFDYLVYIYDLVLNLAIQDTDQDEIIRNWGFYILQKSDPLP